MPTLPLTNNIKTEPEITNSPIPWKLDKTARLSYSNIETSTSYKNSDLLKYALVFHKILEEGVRNKNLFNSVYHPLITRLSSFFQKRIKYSLKRIVMNRIKARLKN